MAPTIEDLFEFLQNDKKERAEEREKDRIELKKLISDKVKKDVMTLLEPFQVRVGQVEEAQEELSDQLKAVNKEIKQLKEQLVSRGSTGQIASVHSPSGSTIRSAEAPQKNYRGEQNLSSLSDNNSVNTSLNNNELLEIISLGRRTVGLHKIDSSDLDRMRHNYFPSLSENSKKLQIERNLAQERATKTDNPEDWRIFRALRNQTTASIRRDRKKWEETKFSHIDNSCSDVWKSVKGLLG